jgi:predicted nucleotidyltransferase component of viral defense system
VIDAREIVELAGELSLRPEIVEKDYVLGWVLAGIAAHADLSASWVFKGGTCLKKAYFETYRFSEDLDFTVLRREQVDETFLVRALGEVAGWVYGECGVEIPRADVAAAVRGGADDRVIAEARIYYRGPLTPRGSLPRIKFDLTADERVVLHPIEQRIHHPYSDEPTTAIRVACYPFAEIFAEKIRALGDRGRPRDLYDVINLHRRPEAIAIAGDVRDILIEKCAFKSLAMPTLAAVQAFRDELASDWEPMLGHQLPHLPPFESYWDELPGFFRWLERAEPAVTPQPWQMDAGETVLRPAIGALGRLRLPARPLETIRFAAANRLCVDLDYVKLEGRRSVRRIEPYSLRRTRDGNVVLHALHATGGEHRAYRVDRIRGAAITDQNFRPKYAIELSPQGPQSIPSTSRATATTYAPSTPRRRLHVYRCPACGKEFRHSRPDARLRRHLGRDGLACPGRAGFLVSTSDE